MQNRQRITITVSIKVFIKMTGRKDYLADNADVNIIAPSKRLAS